MCFFSRILESLPPLPRQHSAAIGCSKNYQPIGVTVHSHCVESVAGFLQRCRRRRGCSEVWKTQFFLNTLYLYHFSAYLCQTYPISVEFIHNSSAKNPNLLFSVCWHTAKLCLYNLIFGPGTKMEKILKKWLTSILWMSKDTAECIQL